MLPHLRLDERRIRGAARQIAARPRPPALVCGLEAATDAGVALGRFCDQVRPRMFGLPSADDLDAVRDLGALGLATATAPACGLQPGCDPAMALARACRDAADERLIEPCGSENWPWWVSFLISIIGDMVDRASYCDMGSIADCSHRPPGARCSESGQLRADGDELLRTSLQTLALFDVASTKS